ncbi:MAG: hypothetical protein CL424_19530 [Acidimicrobiaceae bacterium]|nr:hypothetical protein [Acidimicrobiaceae bacterium]
MARPARFTVDSILDVALTLHAQGGTAAVSTAAIVAAGIPSGSIYHRFVSRQHLLTAMWLRSVDRFRSDIEQRIRSADTAEALAAVAVSVFDWAQENPDDAAVLLDVQRSDVSGVVPESVVQELEDARRWVAAAVSDAAGRLGVPDIKITFAVVDVPSAAVRRARDLPVAAVPPLRDVLAAAALAVLTSDEPR